jgi:hypothetical protein
MLEINKEEIAKFKQEVDKLTTSMERLKDISSVNLKVALPSSKAIEKFSTLNSTLDSIDVKKLISLNQSLTGLSSSKGNGLVSINRDISALAEVNVVSAMGNMRDIAAAYNKFKVNTTQTGGEKEGTLKGNSDTFSSDLSSITKFLNLSRKVDPSKITQMVDSLKGLGDIKIDENTAKFMENANGALNSKTRQSKESNNTANFGSFSGGRESKADIAATVATALTVLGSGVFLKKQANTAKDVVDLLSASEITGLDAFTNRAGITALGISPTTVANQQRQMNRELMSARLFGEIDPKRLILHGMLGTNFESSSESIMKNSLKLSPKMADFIISELFGDEFAIGAARYRNATKGATKQERKDLDSVIFSKAPNIDVGSYTRFLLHFEGFLALSKVLFQSVLGPSIKTLEVAFTNANRYLLSINSKSAGFQIAQKIINAFVSSFVNIVSLVAKGLEKIGDLIIKYNLGDFLIKVASILGTVVAGGAILRVIGITTTLLTSLLGFKTVFSLANMVIGTLGGLVLGTSTTKGGKGGGGTSGGGFLGKSGGIITVALAANSIESLGRYLTMPTDSDTYWKDKISGLLQTTSAVTATAVPVAAGSVYGLPAAAFLAAISAIAYGGHYTLENPEKTRDLLEGIKEAILTSSTPGVNAIEVKLTQDADGKFRRANASRGLNQ